MEFDIEIKPIKYIKGQGLAKLMAKSNCQALDINFIAEMDNGEEMATPRISQAFIESPCYADIIYVLQNFQAPPELSRTKSGF